MTEEEDAPPEEVAGQERAGTPARKHAWTLAAVVLLVAAALLLWLGHAEATFVVATLGVLAWFLNVRANLPRREED